MRNLIIAFAVTMTTAIGVVETPTIYQAVTGRPMTSAMDLVPSAWRGGVRTAVNFVTGNSVSSAASASADANAAAPAIRRVSTPTNPTTQPPIQTPTGSAPVGPLAIHFAVLLAGYGVATLRRKD